ncbi:DUF1707 SHOCT-like domain-containing protein [Pseudonocardia humida]|uniref:DUF1707 domain-containing protein n=1 Tax=Pseudonocardia humida TaxID=2800819 RepID=A0ABT1A6Q8_9PSEU|nr:DUF1707 domain-containing protein [Pseudonocardia humida]MCO1658711.1 DUF1707 domain-containing protein [Pseudonocardia humida]
MTDPIPARDLRVSDDERRHVIALLERATGRGVIDLDEFTSRVDTALAARTRGELNAVLVDLPGLVHPDRPTGPPATRAAAPQRRAARAPVPGGGELLSAQLGSVNRRGRWEVPGHLRIQVAMGTVELDFTETDVPATVEIDFDVTAGSVELRLPEHARVDRDGISATLASIEEKLRGGDGSGPLFVLRGSVRAGSVEVKGPRRRWLRKR